MSSQRVRNEAREGRKGLSVDPKPRPSGYCGRHKPPLVETLHKLSLLISLAPILLPAYAVAFLLVRVCQA